MAAASSATLEVSSGAIWFGGAPCGAATTTNTDTINVAGHVGTVEDLVVSMLGGEFAPGVTAEAAPGISEIEINVNARRHDGRAHGRRARRATTRSGSVMSGVNLNADTDRDISFAQAPDRGDDLRRQRREHAQRQGRLRVGDDLPRQGRDHQRRRRRPHPGRLGQRRARRRRRRTSRSRVRTATTPSTAVPATTSCSVRAATTTMTGGAGADEFLGATGNDIMHAEDDEADVDASTAAARSTRRSSTSGSTPIPSATENQIPS